MSHPSAVLRAGVALLALGSYAFAALFAASPTADALVTGGSATAGAGLPDKNYGAAGALMVSPAGAAKGEIQTLLKFNLAAVTSSLDSTFGAGQWMIEGITLQLGTNFGTQGAQPNNAIFNSINGGLFKIDWLANDGWSEGTGTPSAPTTDGVTFNSLASLQSAADKVLGTFTYSAVGNTNPPTVPAATYSFTLDASLLADVAAGNDVSFRAYAGDSSVGYLFNSKTFGTVANRPLLIVSAVPVPEPGTASYVVGLAVGWCFCRHRHARGA